MTIFDQIKADREAGTPGPWVQGGTLTHTSAFDHYDPFGPDGGSVACVCGEPEGEASERDVANARRIARVPQLECIALVAEDNDAMFEDIRDCLKGVLNTMRPGPDGEGQDEIDILEAIISDCETQMAKHAEASA